MRDRAGNWGVTPRRVLLSLVMFVTAAGAGVWGLWLWRDYSGRLAEVQSNTASVCRLLEEHARRTVANGDRVLSRVIALIDRGILDPTVPSEAGRRDLQQLAGLLLEAGTLVIADDRGQVVLSSSRFPPRPHGVDQRIFFHAHADASRGLVIGPLYMAGAAAEIPVFTLSRRYELADGHYLVVFAAIYTLGYTDFLGNLNLGSRGLVALVGDDGRYLLRQPGGARFAGASAPVMAALPPLLAAGATVMFRHADHDDDTERLMCAERVAGWPMLVVAGTDITELAESGQPWVMRSLFVGLPAAAVFVVLAVVALRSQRREEAALAAVRLANDALEARVLARTADATRSYREAERAEAAKSRFFAAASHDLRQPLQAARLFQDVLIERLHGRDREIAEKAMQAMDGSAELLRVLLDISTLEAGMVAPEPRDISLAVVLAPVAEECEPQASARGLDFRVVSTDLDVHTDPVLLRRIVRNLLVNAIRYTPTGRVLLGCRRQGRSLRIEVWDTGIGVAEDQLGVIFEDFYQVGNAERDRCQGLGLGLSIVERTAVLLGHQVGVRSVAGKGSVFWVTVGLAGEARGGTVAPSDTNGPSR